MTPPSTAAADYQMFLSGAARHLSITGAIAPTLPTMARTLAAIVPSTHPVTVIELGPGTGAVSTAIHTRLTPGSRHIAIEIDPHMINHLHHTHPWLEVIHGNATHLTQLLTTTGTHQADAIVSTLPWSMIPTPQQTTILQQIAQTLAPGAAFSTVVGLHARPLTTNARRFRHHLTTTFDEVLTTSTIWRNIPPSRSYVCRRPRV
ncbi:methyltransferase [Microtetraspora sp. NBRC 13810]|uniref:class I SAM-dependent methyltransferase n=1 Tax=Microtetraspora sp. NBRC 13810 TaxID=3030990 RepID=UPI0024A5934D|nr:methyltransferase domain-containing protein [Microtetraspora sp. NBRC 13810]GLW12731.1 methyltransferase [Microtetraspora sp. NBRC 13810]